MIRLVDHVNFAAQDISAMKNFFVEALGFEDGPRPDVPFPGHWLYAGGRAIVHLQLAKGPVAPSRDSVINHAAFEVDDLDAIAARLDQRGIAYRTIQMDNAPVRQLFVEGPEGVIIELNAPRVD